MPRITGPTIIALVLSLLTTLAPARPDDEALTIALSRAGNNRSQLDKALKEVPADQSDSLRWLLARMPERDLQSLSAQYLLDSCEQAHAAWRAAPWHAAVPEDVFRDAILPYASVNEVRDEWRKDFRERCLPLIAGIDSASKAAAILNQKIFTALNVKYSTKRRKAEQNASESIESGLASCTGLSIILIDACRSVGIPARFVGTALWSDKSGNHSWVEIWDNGWHFTGAAEPSGDALNQGWFTDRAATARRDDPMMAIYAVTWRDTALTFPMVWAPRDQSVRAVNVTDRYTTKAQPLPEGKVRIRVRITGPAGRLASSITITDLAGATLFEGTTKDERFDANDHLTAILPLGERCKLTSPGLAPMTFTVDRDEQLVELRTISEKSLPAK